jgi:hypothetical protein
VSSLEPFRFLHTGDLHPDSPVEGLSPEAPSEVLAIPRGATNAAWGNVVDAAIERRVDFIHQVIDFTCHAWTAELLDPDGHRTVAVA